MTEKCRRCGGVKFERLPRIGFLQRHVLPFFHRYPWRCVQCHKRIYHSARNNAEMRG